LAEGGKREVEKGFHLWPATFHARLKNADQKKKPSVMGLVLPQKKANDQGRQRCKTKDFQ